MRYLSLIALFLATSCKAFVPPIPMIYPANLVAECPALPDIKTGADIYDLGIYTIHTVGAYNDCSDRHRKLAELVNAQAK